jgi:hypothetical protein
MTSFDATSYSPAVAELLREPRLAPLDGGSPNKSARPLLAAMTDATLFAPHAVSDAQMAAACRAALWLYHDFLREAHTTSQGIDTTSGGYWHGLMHRREPDFENARYWFRRVGAHPVFEPLRAAAAELAADAHAAATFLATQSRWDPFAFIDLCEASHTGRGPCELLCRQIQQSEWELLFDYCYRAAIGQG